VQPTGRGEPVWVTINERADVINFDGTRGNGMADEEVPAWVKPHIGTLQLVSGVAGDIAKVATIISVVSVLLSTILLVDYLRAVRAPFPISASYTPTLLVVLATTFALVFFGFASTMAWVVFQVRPFWSATLRHDVPLLRSHVTPFKWRKPPTPSRATLRRRRRSSGKALLEYALVFPSFLIFWLCVAVGTVVNWQPSGWAFLIVFLSCLIAGVAVSGSGFYLLKSRVQSDDDSILRLMRSIRFASLALAESVLTLILLAFFVVVSGEIGQEESPRLYGLLTLLIVLCVHAMANTSRLRPMTTIIVLSFLLFWIISVPLGLSMYGALSLRWLGIGGGLAREITIRSYDTLTGNPIIKVVRGCVLIKTGDEIAIHPASSPSECQLSRFLHNSIEPEWRVNVYPTSAIIETQSLISGQQQPK
jgi:hypothetical protein